MKTSLKALTIAGVWTVGCLTIGVSPARAQAFSLGYSSPGLSVSVGTGGYGYYGGGYYGGYPAVAPGYRVVAPVGAGPREPALASVGSADCAERPRGAASLWMVSPFPSLPATLSGPERAARTRRAKEAAQRFPSNATPVRPLEQGFRPPVLGVGFYRVSALGEQVKLLAPPHHGPADQFFALKVALGCVDDVQAGVERSPSSRATTPSVAFSKPISAPPKPSALTLMSVPPKIRFSMGGLLSSQDRFRLQCIAEVGGHAS